jgi:hypothetical protein
VSPTPRFPCDLNAKTGTKSPAQRAGILVFIIPHYASQPHTGKRKGAAGFFRRAFQISNQQSEINTHQYR